jgi:cobalamin biosynthesis protein CobT
MARPKKEAAESKDSIKNAVKEAMKTMAKDKDKDTVKETSAPAVSAADAGGKVNKSQLVRDYLGKNPKATPKSIAIALGQQGVVVTPNYVSIVKFQMKRLRGRGRRPVVVAPDAVETKPVETKVSEKFSLETLIQAKKLAEALGGVDNARQALAALSKIMG